MFEKKYKTNELYVGYIANQSKVYVDGTSILDYGFHWNYDNFDVGVFVKKKNQYYRISTSTVYPVASRNTQFRVVINNSSLDNIAILYPDFAKDYPILTKTQVLTFEKLLIEKHFKDKSEHSENTL